MTNMDTKDVTAILLKVVGLVMLAFAAFELPAYFPPQSSSSEYSFIGALMQAAGLR
jgi:hypothetical protein